MRREEDEEGVWQSEWVSREKEQRERRGEEQQNEEEEWEGKKRRRLGHGGGGLGKQCIGKVCKKSTCSK